VAAGNASNSATGLIGRLTSSPLQFGQAPAKWVCAHGAQKVHSKLQIIASWEAGGKSRSQHSQFGLISNMAPPVYRCAQPDARSLRMQAGRATPVRPMTF